MHAHSDRLPQTPTHAIPSVKHSGVFVLCFIADTFSTPWCLYSISCCPCSRKELKLFVRLMQRRQSVPFTLIRLYLSGLQGKRGSMDHVFYKEVMRRRKVIAEKQFLSLWKLLIHVFRNNKHTILRFEGAHIDRLIIFSGNAQTKHLMIPAEWDISAANFDVVI